MEENLHVRSESREEITTWGYRFVIIWVSCILLLYAGGGYAGFRLLRSYAAETVNIREARIESPSAGTNSQESAPVIPPGAKPVDVLVGVRINRVGEFSVKESAWTADFTIWFFWNKSTVEPGKDFRIVGGQIKQKEKETSYRRDSERYAEYHVAARMKKEFDTTRFPFGEQGLVIKVEDDVHGADTLRYVADTQSSGVDPEAMPGGLHLIRFMTDVKTGIFRAGPVKSGTDTAMREPRSWFIAAMLIEPDSLGIYLKMFQALFASVAVALVGLFIKPIHVDPRFGIPVGGFFAAVANNVFVSTLLPYSSRHTLTDMVNATGLFTIFLILVQSAASLYIFDSLGRERLSLFFDRISFAAFLIGYIAVNLALPLAARPL